MKYGESLRQRSIPAWGHRKLLQHQCKSLIAQAVNQINWVDNIDYDDIKHFIKENTTPGEGKSVSIPGSTDTKAREFEDTLYGILFEQHQRITLFVRSKAGEIKRRLEHLEKQIQRLNNARPCTNDRIPAKRLEKYGKIEGDVVKAGDEIRSLSRFIGAQQTAFRKILKKYKKWTGSADLELHFREEVMDSQGSFTKVDLGPLLDEWAQALQAVRTLYEERMSRSNSVRGFQTLDRRDSQQVKNSLPEEVEEIVRSGTAAEFDTLLATLPLGKDGKNAVYWIHPDNVVELQVLLLQYVRTCGSDRRTGSMSTPSRKMSLPTTPTSPSQGYFWAVEHNAHSIYADNLEDYMKQQSSKTVEEREDTLGVMVQNAKVTAKWATDDSAIVSVRAVSRRSSEPYRLPIKRKYLKAFFDTDLTFDSRKATVPSVDVKEAQQEIDDMRNWLVGHKEVRPLATLACNRTRFVDLTPDNTGVLLAALDKDVEFASPSLHSNFDSGEAGQDVTKFPFVVLRVRQEGNHANSLVHALDQNHLVERIRGFSLEYHAVWQCCQPENIPAPFWLPLLDKDIRKVPQAPRHRNEDSAVSSYFGSQSTTPNLSTSATSVDGAAPDSIMAAKSRQIRQNTLPSIANQLETPPLSAFRKKRRGHFAPKPFPLPRKDSQPQYWNEYDNPSDGEDGDAYIIYVDPNAESTTHLLIRKVKSLFGLASAEREPLLYHHDDLEAGSPLTEQSSDEDPDTPTKPQRRSYGTILSQPLTIRTYQASTTSASRQEQRLKQKQHWIPRVALTCLFASLIILATAFVLAATGRRKQAEEVDAGIVFAVICSLVFAVTGVASMLRCRRQLSPGAWGVALAGLGLVATGSGGLCAWVLVW